MNTTQSRTPDSAALASLAEVPTLLEAVNDAPTDKDLVSRTRAGDHGAFAELVGRHERSLLQLAQRYVRNDHDAQEVLQEVFMTTWAKLSSFENRAQLSTWLYRVTVNAALMHLRVRRRRVQLMEVGLRPSSIAAASSERIVQRDAQERPDEQLESRELGQALEQALDRLPSSLRSVFELREVQGRSTRQTATLLAISEGAVKSRLHRARHELQNEIKNCWLQ
jgi:RNA polymerase sigma-70 factor, ECF subfamily